MNAIIDLSYEQVDGISYNHTFIRPGTVLAPNLTGYFTSDHLLPPEESQGPAHSWGESYLNSEPCYPYKDTADIVNIKHNPPYFCRRSSGQQEFAYRFKEYNPEDREKTYPFLTNRVLTVSPGSCNKYTMTSTNPPMNCTISNEAGFVHLYSNSTSQQTSFCVPLSSEGCSATVYIYGGLKSPDLDEDYSCGNRSKWIWAFRAPDPGSPDPTVIFECPITVSQVSNAFADAQQIPNAVARVAAASIGLNGRWSGNISDRIWTQYSFNSNQ